MAVFQAKAVFQQVVQDQCATLVAEGHARDAAVQMLLARICEGRSERPSEEAISAVVSSHPINRLDAQHALVVKQEIGACMRRAPLCPPLPPRARLALLRAPAPLRRRALYSFPGIPPPQRTPPARALAATSHPRALPP